jgi:pSer/pThr/pTyr-binding forkhead associated (FHA) protein/NADPH-dependent 2,4-dienoyl-CoA reductase/sulfur reductase-like enzyme
MRYVIIGDGATGVTAAYYIRNADPSATLTIVADDPNPAYYRAALTNYLMGELREAQLFAVPPDFYIETKVERVLARVTAVDTRNQQLSLADGNQLAYDQLLIASGSRPNTPTFTGSELTGVMTMRTLQDVRTVMDGIKAGQIKRAVVTGGGPLGIEWVQGLMKYKIHVTYLLRGDMFFEKALDRTASDLVISRLRAEGVDVRLNEEIEEAIGDRNGRLKALRLKNSKQTIDCQLMGAAIGIRPNVEFLEGSGITVAKDEKRGTLLGVTVDKHMRTNIPNVYAGGDVIHRTLGLWEPARLQGRIAGRNMAGGSDAYQTGAHYNATRLYDLDFSSVGELNNKPGDKVLIDFPRGSGRISYRKLIVRGNKLVGALMLGQRKERVRRNGLLYKKLIDAGTDVSSVAEHLLEPDFDLPNWIDSLNISQQIDAAKSLIMTAAGPISASIRKSENVAIAKTMAFQPIKTFPASLYLNGKQIPFERLIRIGRGGENQLILDDKLASGKHAQIELQGVAYFLIDHNSTNGTFVNETRVTAPRPLKNGDSIRIGETTLRFEFLAAQEVASVNVPEEIPVAAVPADSVLGSIEYKSRRIEIRNETITLGRDPEATITIEDPTASFMHAQISRYGNDLFLRDLGSRNGTLLNGNLLTTPRRLREGDRIRIGDSELKFHAGSIAASQPVASMPRPQDAPEQKNYRLVVQAGSTLGLTFALKRQTMAVGRDAEINDIDLSNQSVSRRHARLDWKNNQWVCVDLQSANGTSINGEALKAGQEKALREGDEIQFGDVRMKFEVPDAVSMLVSKSKLQEALQKKQIEKPAPIISEAQPAQVRDEKKVDGQPAGLGEKEAASPPVQPESAKSEATQFFASTVPTRLKILAGRRGGQTIMLVNLPIILGRIGSPTVQGLEDEQVSRQHLDVSLMPDGNIGVSDRGSVNGTFLNGLPLEPNRVAVINKGDELRLGSTVLKAE